ncbi:MAG: Two component transcriptional regulator, LytTR family [Bacteroidetes bacterium]|nr:Two component transcriptional regulator, LytTR family [Bacteroidota bacterium]
MPDEINSGIMTVANDVLTQKAHVDRVLVKNGGRVAFVRVEEIDWIEAQGNYLRLHRGSESHLVRQTMNEMEASLDPRRFLRIHRSTIVNIERIKELRPLIHGDYIVVLFDSTALTLSRNYRHKVSEYLGKVL